MPSRRRGRTPYTVAPTAIIHSGELEAMSVAFSGVEVCSARYCSAL